MAATDEEANEWLQAALAQHRSGKLPQAEALYRKVLHVNPVNPGALKGLGLIALKIGELDAAGGCFEAVLKINPQSGETHRFLGHVYSARQDHANALASFKQALALDPTDSEARSSIEISENGLKVANDPDYSRFPEAPWAETDWIWEDYRGNDTLMVLFSGLGVGGKPPIFIFFKFLKQYDHIDKLYLRDLDKGWFLNGLGDHASDVDSTAEFLKAKVAGYKRVVFMGCSAGATGAVLFGELLNVDKVLAFAPQTVVSEAIEQELGDRRWPRSLAQLRQRVGDSQYLDLKNLNPFSTDIDIHCAAGLDVDCLHADRIIGDRLNHFRHEGCDDHIIALHLRDSGQLKEIVDREVL